MGQDHEQAEGKATATANRTGAGSLPELAAAAAAATDEAIEQFARVKEGYARHLAAAAATEAAIGHYSRITAEVTGHRDGDRTSVTKAQTRAAMGLTASPSSACQALTLGPNDEQQQLQNPRERTVEASLTNNSGASPGHRTTGREHTPQTHKVSYNIYGAGARRITRDLFNPSCAASPHISTCTMCTKTFTNRRRCQKHVRERFCEQIIPLNTAPLGAGRDIIFRRDTGTHASILNGKDLKTIQEDNAPCSRKNNAGFAYTSDVDNVPMRCEGVVEVTLHAPHGPVTMHFFLCPQAESSILSRHVVATHNLTPTAAAPPASKEPWQKLQHVTTRHLTPTATTLPATKEPNHAQNSEGRTDVSEATETTHAAGGEQTARDHDDGPDVVHIGGFSVHTGESYMVPTPTRNEASGGIPAAIPKRPNRHDVRRRTRGTRPRSASRHAAPPTYTDQDAPRGRSRSTEHPTKNMKPTVGPPITKAFTTRAHKCAKCLFYGHQTADCGRLRPLEEPLDEAQRWGQLVTELGFLDKLTLRDKIRALTQELKMKDELVQFLENNRADGKTTTARSDLQPRHTTEDDTTRRPIWEDTERSRTDLLDDIRNLLRRLHISDTRINHQRHDGDSWRRDAGKEELRPDVRHALLQGPASFTEWLQLFNETADAERWGEDTRSEHFRSLRHDMAAAHRRKQTSRCPSGGATGHDDDKCATPPANEETRTAQNAGPQQPTHDQGQGHRASIPTWRTELETLTRRLYKTFAPQEDAEIGRKRERSKTVAPGPTTPTIDAAKKDCTAEAGGRGMPTAYISDTDDTSFFGQDGLVRTPGVRCGFCGHLGHLEKYCGITTVTQATIERAPKALKEAQQAGLVVIGDSFIGKDGLVRTPGRRCGACGLIGHLEKYCDKTADAGGRLGLAKGRCTPTARTAYISDDTSDEEGQTARHKKAVSFAVKANHPTAPGKRCFACRKKGHVMKYCVGHRKPTIGAGTTAQTGTKNVLIGAPRGIIETDHSDTSDEGPGATDNWDTYSSHTQLTKLLRDPRPEGGRLYTHRLPHRCAVCDKPNARLGCPRRHEGTHCLHRRFCDATCVQRCNHQPPDSANSSRRTLHLLYTCQGCRNIATTKVSMEQHQTKQKCKSLGRHAKCAFCGAGNAKYSCSRQHPACAGRRFCDKECDRIGHIRGVSKACSTCGRRKAKTKCTKRHPTCAGARFCDVECNNTGHQSKSTAAILIRDNTGRPSSTTDTRAPSRIRAHIGPLAQVDFLCDTHSLANTITADTLQAFQSRAGTYVTLFPRGTTAQTGPLAGDLYKPYNTAHIQLNVGHIPRHTVGFFITGNSGKGGDVNAIGRSTLAHWAHVLQASGRGTAREHNAQTPELDNHEGDGGKMPHGIGRLNLPEAGITILYSTDGSDTTTTNDSLIHPPPRDSLIHHPPRNSLIHPEEIADEHNLWPNRHEPRHARPASHQ